MEEYFTWYEKDAVDLVKEKYPDSTVTICHDFGTYYVKVYDNGIKIKVYYARY